MKNLSLHKILYRKERNRVLACFEHFLYQKPASIWQHLQAHYCLLLQTLLTWFFFFCLVVNQIHSSWFFFPWHRAYLYFYERILGKLINDPSFALPFWNWDEPAGMSIPLIYRDNSSSLFNPTRYPAAINFTDLGGCRKEDAPSSQQCNLQTVHRQFVAASNSTSLFFGNPLRAGDTSFAGGGTIENSPHSPVHITTGSDMSSLDRAAKDPLFFIHHSNIDRLWAIWDGIPGSSSRAISDPDFDDASFLFWDENMRLVRIKGRDVIDTKKLGYVYEDVPLQWMNIEMTVEAGKGDGMQTRSGGAGINEVVFPILLSDEVRVHVARRPSAENEMLVVSGIELDGRDHVWFRVYVSRASEGGRVEAGCFIQMERRANEKIPVVTELQIGITEFIKEVGAGDDDLIAVILAPTSGGEKVTVGGVSII